MITWLKGFIGEASGVGYTEDEIKERIAYLEKQGECVIDCPQNHQDSNRPSGGIVLEDFNGGEGFYKLNLAYLNKKQVEEVEEMVREWNNEPSTSEEDIKDCIGMCLTDADEQRFKNYHTNLRDCLAWLEKQGEQNLTPKTSFKKGDWVVVLGHHGSTYQIEKIENNQYIIKHILGGSLPLHFCNEDLIRLWTIKDAMNGDVLVNGSNIFKFHSIIDARVMGYCHVNTNDGRFYNDIGNTECFGLIDDVFTPATKEQRDTLFVKMKEAGYEWDAEKKKLKRI